jgi:hypothetical protein
MIVAQHGHMATAWAMSPSELWLGGGARATGSS